MKKAVGVIVTVALSAALGFVAWTSMSGDDQAAPPPSPTASPTTTGAAGVTWRDPRGYRVTHPDGYQRSVFEGDVQIRPQGKPSVESGMDTFAISIQVEAGTADREGCFGEMAAPGTSGTMLINGERVPTCEQIGNNAEDWYRRTFTFSWADQTCDHISLGCPGTDAGITLTIRIVAATKAMWDQYLTDAMAVVESIRRAPPRPNEDVTENIDRTA